MPHFAIQNVCKCYTHLLLQVASCPIKLTGNASCVWTPVSIWAVCITADTWMCSLVLIPAYCTNLTYNTWAIYVYGRSYSKRKIIIKKKLTLVGLRFCSRCCLLTIPVVLIILIVNTIQSTIMERIKNAQIWKFITWKHILRGKTFKKMFSWMCMLCWQHGWRPQLPTLFKCPCNIEPRLLNKVIQLLETTLKFLIVDYTSEACFRQGIIPSIRL